MDNKVKLLSVASVVAVLMSGCSGYNNNQDGSAGAQSADSGQGGGFSQRRPASTTCAPCAAKTTQRNYTYKPAPRTTYRAKPRTTYKPKVVARTQPRRPAGQHNQQYYIDRWNRQQNATRPKARVASKPKATSNYNGGSSYYKPAVGASSATYYDYSTAGRTATPAPKLNTSSKSIYTGSYQQKRTYKPYKPTTYAVGGGSSRATAKAVSYSGGSNRGGSSYVVKKGDTVFEIMRQTGVYWKDIISINNLRAPYNISPGQRIRLK